MTWDGEGLGRRPRVDLLAPQHEAWVRVSPPVIGIIERLHVMTLAMCFLCLSVCVCVCARVCWLFQMAVSRSVATDGFCVRDADMYVGAAACVA